MWVTSRQAISRYVEALTSAWTGGDGRAPIGHAPPTTDGATSPVERRAGGGWYLIGTENETAAATWQARDQFAIGVSTNEAYRIKSSRVNRLPLPTTS